MKEGILVYIVIFESIQSLLKRFGLARRMGLTSDISLRSVAVLVDMRDAGSGGYFESRQGYLEVEHIPS